LIRDARAGRSVRSGQRSKWCLTDRCFSVGWASRRLGRVPCTRSTAAPGATLPASCHRHERHCCAIVHSIRPIGQSSSIQLEQPDGGRITDELVRACTKSPRVRSLSVGLLTRARVAKPVQNDTRTHKPVTALSFPRPAGYYTSHSSGITCAQQQSRCRVMRCRRTEHACRDCPTPRRPADQAETSLCRDPARCRHA
jgi:hypothetical protein